MDAPSTQFRILVVDDDDDIRDTLATFFRDKGLSVVTAKNGIEAIQVMEAAVEPFSIVITDLVMPEKGGLDVLKVAKHKFVDVNVAIVTGYASLESAIEAIKLGAYDYLTKPINLSELEILLKNIGERIGLLEQNRSMVNRMRELHDRLDYLSEGRSKVDRGMAGIERAIEENTHKLDLLLEALNSLKDTVGRSERPIRKRPARRSVQAE